MIDELLEKYIKENNIKSYLILEDIKNIFQKLTDEQIE